MNFQTCQYYISLYETGTITKSAEKLYISQQALSKMVFAAGHVIMVERTDSNRLPLNG